MVESERWEGNGEVVIFLLLKIGILAFWVEHLFLLGSNPLSITAGNEKVYSSVFLILNISFSFYFVTPVTLPINTLTRKEWKAHGFVCTAQGSLWVQTYMYAQPFIWNFNLQQKLAVHYKLCCFSYVN